MRVGEEGGGGSVVQQQRPLVIGWFLHWDDRGPFITSEPPDTCTQTQTRVSRSGKQPDAAGRRRHPSLRPQEMPLETWVIDRLIKSSIREKDARCSFWNPGRPSASHTSADFNLPDVRLVLIRQLRSQNLGFILLLVFFWNSHQLQESGNGD